MAYLTNHVQDIFLCIIQTLENDTDLFQNLHGGKVKFLPRDFDSAPKKGQLSLLLNIGATESFEDVDLDDREKLRCCIQPTGADEDEIQLAFTEYVLSGIHHIDCKADSAQDWIESLTDLESMVTCALRSVDKLGCPSSVVDWNIESIDRIEAGEEDQDFRGCIKFEISLSVEHIFDRPDARCV